MDVIMRDIKHFTPISAEEKRQISLDLEQYHRVFDVFWTLSEIFWIPANHQIKTAAVAFPKGVPAMMMLNVAFWDSLNEDERLFVVLHECLHVMLNHGMRNAGHVEGATPRLINIAQDITINEMIVEMFNFPRGLLRGWERFCWIETCFDNPAQIEQHQVFEYYLHKLIENPPPDDVVTFDDHEGLGDGGMGGLGGSAGFDLSDPDPDKFAQHLAQELSWDELEKMIKSFGDEEGMSRGIALSPFKTVLEQRTPPKVNFNQLVRNLIRSKLSRDAREQDSFAREDRRLSSLGSSMSLPGRMPIKPDGKKLITAMFFDVSGSCLPHIQRFFDCVGAFEKEEKMFDTRTFAFDTRVKELKRGKAPEAEVGGGTAFDIIEEKCREIELEDGQYPDFVVVLTDGAGSKVNPKHPGRWCWLLTKGATRMYVHPLAKAYPLASVVFE